MLFKSKEEVKQINTIALKVSNNELLDEIEQDLIDEFDSKEFYEYSVFYAVE